MSIKIQQYNGSQYNYLPINQAIISNNSLSLNGYTENDFLKFSDNYLKKVQIAQGALNYSGTVDQSGNLYPVSMPSNIIYLYEKYEIETLSFLGGSSGTTSFLNIGLAENRVRIYLTSNNTASTQNNISKETFSLIIDSNYYSGSMNLLKFNIINWSGRGKSLTVKGTYSIYGLQIINFP